MKRITLLAILCTLAVSISFAQDFRKSSWGDTMAEIKASEGDKEWLDLFDDDVSDYLIFEGMVGGLEALIGFFFIEDKLFSGRYYFLEEHITNDVYFNDFDLIDANLQSKYGSTKVEKEWTNDMFKNSSYMWGAAIEQGHLTIYTKWKVPNKNPITEIVHGLTGGDYEILHALEYYSIELFSLFESQMDEENVF